MARTRWLLAASSALWLAIQSSHEQVQVPWKIADNTTHNRAAGSYSSSRWRWDISAID